MNNTHVLSVSELVTGLHWKPNRNTLVALASYVLVVSGLYLAFQVITTEHVAANFITFGPVSMALLGVAIVTAIVFRSKEQERETQGEYATQNA